MDAAKTISKDLLQTELKSSNTKVIGHAFDWLIKELCKKHAERQVEVAKVRQMMDYLAEIHQEYLAYLDEKSNLILFGRDPDMADMANADALGQNAMRVVPMTETEFMLQANPLFTQFLKALGIRRGDDKKW